MAEADSIDGEMRLSSLLAAYHDSITGRFVSNVSADSIEQLDESSLAKLSKAQACLDLLETARRTLKPIETTHDRQSAIEGFTRPLASQSLDSGHRIGRFEIVRQLGHGGHSVVYLASDPSLCRDVALKIPRLHILFSETARRRFVREAHAIARLRHPNIVSIYETSEEARIPFLVEEYCEGPNLAEWLQRREGEHQRISPRAAAQWLLALSDAAAHAHDNRIVHRDLKPANILLQSMRRLPNRANNGLPSQAPQNAEPEVPHANDPEQFVPRITDFGLAKLFSDKEALTMTQAVMGTAAYMAPEQAEGKTDAISPASDIYSLGVILYELLAGRRPIEGKNDQEIRCRVITEEPIPIRRIRCDVPPDLEAICLKCLEKEPENRYAVGAELAADLSSFLQGEPVLARHLGTITRLARSIRRRRFSSRAILLGSFLFGLLLAVVAGASWRSQQQRDAAVAELVEAREEHTAAFRKAYPAEIRRADLLLQQIPEVGTDPQHTTRMARHILARYIPKLGEPDLRGFEWHYLWKIVHPASYFPKFSQVKAIQAHTRDAYFVTFSPNGKRLATSGADCKAHVWNAGTGQLELTLTGHTQDVNCVQFSPDGKSLATASEDGTVRLWDASTGAQREILWKHCVEVVVVAFNPVNGNLAAGAHDGMLKIWDLRTRQEITIRNAHDGQRIDALDYSPDGGVLATVSGSKLRVWDTARSYSSVASFDGVKSQALAFSHNGALLAAGLQNEVHLYRLATRQLLAHVSIPGKQVRSLQFTNDDSSLIVGGNEQAAALLDLTTGEVWNPFGTPGTIWCIASARDGRVATSDSNGTVRVWDCSLRQTFHRIDLNFRKGDQLRIALSPDGRYLAAGGPNGAFNDSPSHEELILWDISGPGPVITKRLGPHTPFEYTAGITFTPDSAKLLYSRWDPKPPESHINWQLREIDLVSGTERCRISEREIPYSDLHLDRTGTILVTHYRESGDRPMVCKAQFRDLSSGRVLTTLPLHRAGCRIALSPIEDILALAQGGPQGNIEILNTSDRKRVATLPARFKGDLQSLEFTQDGRFLVARDQDGCVTIVSLTDSHALHQVNVPESADCPSPASLSPDGRTLAVGATLGILLADAESGQVMCTLPFPRPVQEVKAIAFGSGGRSLAADGYTADGQCGVYLWQIDHPSEVTDRGHLHPRLEKNVKSRF